MSTDLKMKFNHLVLKKEKNKHIHMPNKPDNSQKNIEKLLKQHIELSQKIEEQNKKIQRRINLMVIGSYVRLLIILIPIILGIIYIPSFIKEVQSSINGQPILSQIFSGSSSSNTLIDLLSGFSQNLK